MKIFLFVSSGCPHCPRAEEIVKRVLPDYYSKGLSYSKIRIKTSEGKNLSVRYNIKSTPTALILDDSGKEIKRIVGVPSEDNLRRTIEKTLGLKGSFIDKIFGWKK